MTLLPPFFLDTVVAIGRFDATANRTDWLGSGFLLADVVQRDGDQAHIRLYLVTNSHIASGLAQARIRFNLKAAEPAREFELDFPPDQQGTLWFTHPNPKIDVAVVPINTQLLRDQGVRMAYFLSDQHVLNLKDAAELGVAEGDGVYVLGFPLGMVGETRNYVIVRQGCIARLRDALEDHSTEVLVDAAVFPGNSGGPVVMKPEFGSIQGTKRLHRALLLGVVAAYLPYKDIAISRQTGRPRVTFEENSGLATVIPYDFIAETIRQHSAQFPTGEAPVKERPVTPQEFPPS